MYTQLNDNIEGNEELIRCISCRSKRNQLNTRLKKQVVKGDQK